MPELSELTPIEPLKPIRYEVHHYGGNVTTHRVARCAIEAAAFGEGQAYAVFADGYRSIQAHKGALGRAVAVDSTRYLDADGTEWVKCADGHFERAETRDDNGALLGYYTSIVLA